MSAKLFTIGYGGFNYASQSSAPGWLLWSGSFDLTGSGAPNETTTYGGLGIEIIQNKDNFLRFSTNPSQFEIQTQKFFVGTLNSQFISGSDGNIEISSSNFHLTNTGDVTMQGTITATAGDIGGFTITNDALASDNLNLVLSGSGQITASAGLVGGLIIGDSGLSTSAFKISSSTDTSDPVSFISSSNFKVSAGGRMTASAGEIAGFTISSTQISDASNNLILKSSGQITGSTVKFTGGDIAGWTISSDKLEGGLMSIQSAGTIESTNFASDVPGSGFRLTAADGGFLEVENAKIRGTLSTTTFEKETVNAVGGQLYVANSTVLTGSGQLAADVATAGVHRSTDTTMSVANASGFAQGEILTLKKVTDTGFTTEYIYVESASREDAGSDTDFTGKLYVQRGYGNGLDAGDTSGSIGGIASTAQFYSGSQVIASTGKIGTGYIRINANHNDPKTPFIDIVERTGSGIYDIELKARLGDLKGLSSARLHGTDPQNAGFGLYSENVFLEGGIVANTGSIGGVHMQSGKLFTGVGNHNNTDTGFYLDSTGQLSLGNKLSWNGSTLSINGQVSLGAGSTLPDGTDITTVKTVDLSADQNIIVYNAAGDNGSGTITLTASASNFTDAYFKFTGGGSDFDDETSYTDGTTALTDTATFTIPTNFSSTPYTFTVSVQEGSSGGEVASDTITIASVKPGNDGAAGSAGSDAKTVKLTSPNYVISYDAAGSNPTPSGTLTLSGSSQNFTDAYFKFTGDGVVDDVAFDDGSSANGASKEFTIPSSYFSTPMDVRVGVAEGDQSEVAFDTITISAVQPGTDGNDGADAYNIVLTNESHTLPSASDGTINFAGSGTQIWIYKGNQPLDSVATGGSPPGSGEFTVAATGTNITPGAVSVTSTQAVIGDHSSYVGTGPASVNYVINIENSILFTRSQSLSLSVEGEQGDDAYTVILSNESHTLPSSSAGVVNHAGSGTTITVFKGATELDSVLGQATPTTGQFKVTATGTNITPGTLSNGGGANNPVTVADHSNYNGGTDPASVNYSINLEGLNTIVKSQSFSLSIEGPQGATGATGATGPNFDFLTGSLSTVDTTGGLSAGLLLTDTVFGFHDSITAGDGTNAQLSDFTSYLDSSGNFYLGSGGNPDSGSLSWDNTAGVLSIVGDIEVTNPGGNSFSDFFGGPSGSTIAPVTLFNNDIITGSSYFSTTGTKASTENGVLTMSSSNTWDAGIATKQRFNRHAAQSLVADIRVLSQSLGGGNSPRMMIGFGDADKSLSTTVDTWKTLQAGVYFFHDQINIFQDELNAGVVPGSDGNVALGDTYRVVITPEPVETDGYNYKIYKHPNLSASLYETSSFTGEPTASILDARIVAHNDEPTFEILNFESQNKISSIHKR